MKFVRTSIFLLVVMVVVAPAAMGEEVSQASACSEAQALLPEDVPIASVDSWLEAEEPIETAAESLRSKAGSLIASEEKGPECEWFWIECNNGTEDECCGSVSSCGAYCAEVCGGPCIYVE